LLVVQMKWCSRQFAWLVLFSVAISATDIGWAQEDTRRRTILPYGWEVDTAAEVILSSDIQLTHLIAGLADRQTLSQFNLRVARDGMGVDYEPVEFDLNGESTRLDEATLALQGSLRQAVTDRLTIMAAAGLYDGFRDYRSLWLAEYYRQQFAGLGDIPGFDTYQDPDPHGLSGAASLRWEYLPASGFLQIEAGYARDEIAPGYEIDFDGLHAGTRVLETRSVVVSVENVLSRRVRTQVQLRAADTTEREIRWSALGAFNLALSPIWRVRARIGGAIEEPEFRSLYGSLAVERDLSERVSVFVYGRAYQDTGEIEDALMFSAAAPGLRSWAAGIGLKGTGGRFGWRVSWAPYRTDYEETGLGTAFFSNLYRDRSWNIGEVSGLFRF
jgi:hypothetical protein